MLRLPDRRPHQLRVDRLADYMREFANLLGLDNKPMFAGIKDASTGLRVRIPHTRKTDAWRRVQKAKADPNSRPGRHLRQIEDMLGQDHFSSAELRDSGNNVIYLFRAHDQVTVDTVTIRQSGEVDGVVTGLIGADDTMHLHLRDHLARDLKLVIRDESMARDLLQHFRKGVVRVRVHGLWVRSDDGWIPETNRCVVDGFTVLDESTAGEVFQRLASIEGNGWVDLADPLAVWRDLRGLH